MFKYKNTSSRKQTIPGVGEVDPGGVIESDQPLHNANLTSVNEPKDLPKSEPVQSIQPPVSQTRPTQAIQPPIKPEGN